MRLDNEAESAVLNFDDYLAKQPEGNRSALQSVLDATPEEDRPRQKKLLASMIAVSKSTGLDLPTVDSKWDTVRAGLSEQLGGEWLAVKDDDEAFYGQLQKAASKSRDERYLVYGPDNDKDEAGWKNSLVYRAQEAAMVGKGYASALGEWQAATKAEQRPEFAIVARDTYAETAEMLERVRPAAEQAYEQEKAYREGRGGDKSSWALFRGMTPKEKRLTFRLMSEKAGADEGEDKSFTQRSGEAFGRGFENLALGGGSAAFRTRLLAAQFAEGDSVSEADAVSEVGARFASQAVAQSGASMSGGYAQAMKPKRKLTAEEARQWNIDVANAREDLDTAEQLRVFGQRVIDPADKDSAGSMSAGARFFVGKMWLPLMDSAAIMATVGFTPGVEMAAMQYQGEEYLRLREGRMSPEAASQNALYVGTGKAGLDRLQFSALGKTLGMAKALPGLTKMLGRFSLSGTFAQRAGVSFGATFISQTGIELVQDHVVPALVQDLASIDPRFDVEWGNVWRETVQAIPDTALGMVLLSGMSGVSEAYTQSAFVREFVASPASMRLRGYSMEQIAEIQAARPIDQGKLLAQYMPTTAPAEGPEREALVRDVVTLSRIEQQRAADRQIAENVASVDAADYAIRVTRKKDGWEVTQKGGAKVMVDSVEAARRIREDLRLVGNQAEAESLMSILDDWTGKADKNTTREAALTGETVTEKKGVTTFSREGEGVTREIVTPAALAREMEMIGASEVGGAVFGMNSVNIDKATRQIVQTLEIYRSPSAVETALHEIIESNAKALKGTGVISDTDIVAAVNSVAFEFDPGRSKNADDKAFRERVQRVANGTGNATEIRETFSELAVADVIGRRKDGTLVRPGMISAALDAAINETRTADEVKALGKVRAFFRAVRQFFRQLFANVSAIKRARKKGGAVELDSLVNRVLGVDEQVKQDEALAEDLEGMADETGLDYTPPTEEDMDNGIAFSVSRFKGVTREEFLGNPKITSDRNASDLKPLAVKGLMNQPAEAFAIGGYSMRYLDGDAAVFDGDKLIASYNFGSTLVVDPKYRRRGIAEELVYQVRARNPNAKPAETRTRASQRIQERVWERIERERRQSEGTTYSVRKAQDAEYMAAVESGDMETAQRMVDEAAKKAGYVIRAWRGSSAGQPINNSGTVWLTSSKDAAESYAEDVFGYTDPVALRYFINPTGIQSLDASRLTDEQREQLNADEFGNPQAIGIYRNSDDSQGFRTTTYHVPVNNVKSADPVTRDETGNVIPLSERFNPARDEITYSVRKVTEVNVKDLYATKEVKGDPAALDELKALAQKHSIPSPLDVANVLERWVSYGMADERGVTPEDAVNARKLVNRYKGETVAAPERDEFFYHVTTKQNAKKIMRSGEIVPGKPAQFATGATQANSRGRVFVTERGGVQFWLDRIQEQLDNNESQQKLTVLQIPKELVIDPQIDNALEKRDDSFFTTSPIKTSDEGTSYRVAPTSSIEAVRRRLDNALARDPEARRNLARLADDRLQTLEYNWQNEREMFGGRVTSRPLIERRTKQELDNEQNMLQALRADELIKLRMAQLSPETLRAYEDGQVKLAESPLIAAMIGDHGKLMSKTEAARRGRYGEYDDVPWLPAFIYSTNGMMPDQMAQVMYDSGLLSQPTPDALWTALGKEVTSFRNAREKYDEAAKAVANAEKQARNQAREEMAEWRREQEEMQARDWSPKARLLRHMRTLDAILSVMPAEVRAKVGGFIKLAALETDEARVKEISGRIEKLSGLLETHLKNESTEALDRLIDRAKPDSKPGEKPKGRIGVEGHRIFNMVEEYRGLSEEQRTATEAALNAQIEKAAMDHTGNEPNTAMIDLLERQQVFDMFAHWDGKSAAEADNAVRWLQSVYDTGRNAWRMQQEQEAQLMAQFRRELVEYFGNNSGDLAQRQERNRALTALQERLAGWGNDLELSQYSFVQVLESILAPNHPLVQRWNRLERAAQAQKTDALLSAQARLASVVQSAMPRLSAVQREQRIWDMSTQQTITVPKMEGVSREVVPVAIEAVRRIRDGTATADGFGITQEEADTLIEQLDALEEQALFEGRSDLRVQNLEVVRENAGRSAPARLTEMEAVALTMFARQEQYKANLQRHGYTDEVIAAAEAGLSPEALAIRSFLSAEYRDGYAPLASLFREMFGIDLPQIANYSPAAMIHTGRQEVMDPQGGIVAEGGFRGGFLKSRRPNLAEPRMVNALDQWRGHLGSTEHWKAFAKLTKELRSVFGNPDVQKAITGARGKGALDIANQWIDALERNGVQHPDGGFFGDLWRELGRVQAVTALAWNIGTILKQSGAAFTALSRVPAREWMRSISRLGRGEVDLEAIRNSPMIQRRMQSGFSPEMRAAMSVVFSGRPNALKNFAITGLENLARVDAFFTSLGAAVTYDYHMRTLTEAGMDQDSAQRIAMVETEDTIRRTAQPVELADRSMQELTSGPGARLLFMFASNQRMLTASIVGAIEQHRRGNMSRGELARVISVMWVMSGLASTLIGAMWRDLKNDDDDELFDSDNWNPLDLVKSVALGPMAGIPLLNMAYSAIMGFPEGGPLSGTARAGKQAYAGIVDLISDDEGRPEPEPVEKTFRASVKAVQFAAAFSSLVPGLEGAASIAALADQGFAVADTLLPDTESEATAKERRAIAKERREARED